MTTSSLVFVIILFINGINLFLFGFAVCQIFGKIDDYKDEIDKRLDKTENDLQSIRSRENFFDSQDQEIRVRLLTGLLTMMMKRGAK